MTFLSMLGLTIIIISVFVYYLYVLCDLLSVAESAWVKLFILVTANISITLFLCLLNYLLTSSYLMMINGTHMMDIVLKQIQDNYILS